MMHFFISRNHNFHLIAIVVISTERSSFKQFFTPSLNVPNYFPLIIDTSCLSSQCRVIIINVIKIPAGIVVAHSTGDTSVNASNTSIA